MSSENNGETTCPSCGFRSRAGAKFCGGCGEPLRASATCSACGAVNESLHRFCVNCGRGIVGASAAAATGAIAADVNADSSDVSGMPAASGRGGLGLPLAAPLRRLGLRGKAVLLLAALVVVVVAAVMLLRDGTDGAAQARDVGGASAIADMLPSGAAEIRLEPEPSTLAVRIAPTEHHAVEMVSNRSAVVKAEYPGQAVIVVHNDTGLDGRGAGRMRGGQSRAGGRLQATANQAAGRARRVAGEVLRGGMQCRRSYIRNRKRGRDASELPYHGERAVSGYGRYDRRK